MDERPTLGTLFSSFWLPLTIGVLGLGALGFGFFTLTSPTTSDEVIITPVSDESADTDELSVTTLFIDVEGAVINPGVYELFPEARVQDAVSAAGGMHKDADRFAVAKSINMAAPLSDGMKLYIPFEGEEATLMTGAEGWQTVAVAGALTSQVNINSASQSVLEELPGIGPVTAKKIIDLRPYKTIDDLLSKKVVGQSVFDKIKAEITVN